jgi:hypothetical protein
MELIHAEQVTAGVTGRSRKGPDTRTVALSIVVLAVAGVATAFAATGIGLGSSTARSVPAVDTSMDDIVAVRAARFQAADPFDRSYDQIEAQRGATLVTLPGTDVSFDPIERLRSSR